MMQNSFKDLAEFFGSTAMTLKAQGQRVRNLIGESHWQSDGTYKERLLKNAIREIVPSTFKVGDGFLIYRKDKEQNHFDVSRQIDVLVYDDRFVAPVFRDSDFVIILAETALAAIEVKSSWGRDCSQLGDGVTKLQSAHHLFRKAKDNHEPDLFTACIAYTYASDTNFKETNPDQMFKKLARQLKKKFIKGLSEYWNIDSDITPDDLKLIYHHGLITSLCPQMILSLDVQWIITPRTESSVDKNKPTCQCPVVTQVSTSALNEKDEIVNFSLHLFLSTLRNRCIEWLNYHRSVPEFESLRTHLNTLIHNVNYPTISDRISLIHEMNEAHEMFPQVQFLK